MFTTNRAPLTELSLRQPVVDDAADIWRLVRQSSVLDDNSCYAYLLLCKHFADTCVVAASHGSIRGVVTAYRPPAHLDVIFVWQIGVAADARRQGLAKRMLHSLVLLPACQGVRFVEATVTPSNVASRRLFQSFAKDLEVPCRIGKGFTAEAFGGGGHEEEELFRIGPLR